jgi:glyoxylase-like metal-dependent hydrolase (beta-lactamase superfamily II)
MRKHIYLPDADRAETIELPVSAFFVRHAQGNVLFDSGCHPSVAENAEQRWGGMSRFMTPIFQPDENVITGLNAIGISPDDVDVVICSHLHPDHCGCNAFFRKATFVCHSKELSAARAPEAAAKGYLPMEWDQPMGFHEISGEHDLFNDERIVLIPVPGHTPGTLAALVNLDRSGSFLLASDAVALKAHLDKEVAPKNNWNADLALASIAAIKRIEASGATVLYGHDDEQWRTLKKGAQAYD